MTQQELDQIRSDNEERKRLKREATPAPWTSSIDEHSGAGWIEPDINTGYGYEGEIKRNDINFIVAARNSDVEGVVDKLIEQVRELLVLKNLLSDIKSEEGRAYELGRIEERVKCIQTIAEMQFMYDATKIEQNDQRVVGKIAIAVFAEHVKEAIRKQS